MCAHREPRAKEKYQLNFSMAASSSSETVTIQQTQVNPVGWGTSQQEAEAPIEETVAVMTTVQAPVEAAMESISAEADPRPGVSFAPIAEHEDADGFRSSPKSGGSIDRPGGLLSNRLRTLSVLAWSGLAAGGAVLVSLGPSSVIATRLAEVGGLWAAIAAAIWVLTTKLKG